MMNYRARIYVLLTLFVVASSISAQVSYTKADSLKFVQYVDQFRTRNDLSISDLFVQTALFFIGTPYVASTLDRESRETLVVNLHEFDCNTFVETCIALARTVKSNEQSFDIFCNNLRQIRYRNNRVDDYTSRLHYVSDWIFENENQSLLIDKTPMIGGQLQAKEINFMSSHFDKYPALKNNKRLLSKIISVEGEINKRDHFFVLPKSEINSVASLINDGDIIAFATSIAGLDYSHIGIAYREGRELRFVHASTRTMSVTIESRTLDEYCQQQSKCIGISVFSLINSNI